MATAVNTGARLDRLPITSFHYRIFWLVGAGMFFDGYDLYVGGDVLGSPSRAASRRCRRTPQFISLTFVGMTIGAFVTGFHRRQIRPALHLSDQSGDLRPRFARRRLRAGHDVAERCRFVMGLGLGAEIVVGYSTLTEFVPPKSRGRWLVVHGVHRGDRVPGDRPARLSHHPELRLAADVRDRRHWRADRVVSAQEPAGIAALARSAGPQRGSRGHHAGDRKGSRRRKPLPPPMPAAPARQLRGLTSLSTPPLLPRMIVGSWVLIIVNTLIFGFVLCLPQFFVPAGADHHPLVRLYGGARRLASLGGYAVGASCADKSDAAPASSARRS